MTLQASFISLGRVIVAVLGILSWAFVAAISIYTTIDAVTLTNSSALFRGVIITAAACDLLSLSCLSAFLVDFGWRWRHGGQSSLKKRWILAGLWIVPAIAGAVTTLLTLIRMERWDPKEHNADDSPNYQIWTKLTLWSLAVFFQLCLLAVASFIPLHETGASLRTEDPPAPTTSETRSPLPSMSLTILTPPFGSNVRTIPSPTLSTSSAQSMKSWRFSLQHVVHPISSRAKLVQRSGTAASSFVARDSKSISTETTGSFDAPSQEHHDAFDSWDTSSVDPQNRDAVLQSTAGSPYQRTPLEPIPGSRPVSPARALDGPFPAQDDPASPTTPTPTAATAGTSTKALELLDDDGEPFPTPTRPFAAAERATAAPPSSSSAACSRSVSQASSSRPGSSSPTATTAATAVPSPVDESHIHPLFRRDSPTPPPVATARTVVTASPFSGTPIHRPFSRAGGAGGGGGGGVGAPGVKSRSQSRAASPSPLAKSAAGSFESERVGGVAAREGHDEERGRSLAPQVPVERPITPPMPIPEFVLGASQRSSMLGYGRRTTSQER